MMNTLRIKPKLVLGLFSTLSVFSPLTYSSGISIPLQSTAYIGEARSGGAAIADDASTNYYNAAGLTRIGHQQLAVSISAPYGYERFSGTMVNPGFGFGIPAIEANSTSTIALGIIPNLHYVYPCSPELAFGLSLMVPYGLGLNYPATSLVRYDVHYAFDYSLDLSPSIAYAFSPNFSVGLGLDALYFAIKQHAYIRTQPFTPTDSHIYNQASNVNYGWHAGILYSFSPQTRVGLSYRSQIVTRNLGVSKFYPSPGGFIDPARITSNRFTTKIPLAPLTILSVIHEINPCWTLMGSIEHEGWGVWRYDHAYHVAAPTFNDEIDSITPRKLRDTWFFAIGSRYRINPQWLIRAGIDYLRGSTTTRYRDILITDPDTYGYGIGASYQYIAPLRFDFSFGQAINKTVRINHTSLATGNTLIGKSYQNGYTFSGGFIWNIT